MLHEHGIDNYLFISPIFPFITDINALIHKIAKYIKEIYFENLNLKGKNKIKVLNLIKSNYPQFYNKYLKLYSDKNDFNLYWITIQNQIEEICYKKNIKSKIFFFHNEIIKLSGDIIN